MLDGSAEERYRGGHEHRRRHAFSADIADDEGHIIAVPVEIIQIASDALHRHQRSMEREPVVIDEIVHQNASLDIPRNIHLVLDELMLILHLEVCFLVLLNPAEKQHEHNDTDNQDAERNQASLLDALPNDTIRHGDHQLHVNRVHRLRIDHPMPFVVLIVHLILQRAVVGRSDERAFGTMNETNRLFMRLDILENIFDPLDGEIVPHNAY